VTDDATRTLSTKGSRPIPVGARARVERAGGGVWTGRVSYVNGEVVGLKASTIVAGRLKVGETVTLVFGPGDSMVAAQARVLAASGSFLRLSRRQSSEVLERRRALRVPVDQTVEITCVSTAGTRHGSADLADMSASGCALRTGSPLSVGHSVTISLCVFGTDLALTGKVVRTWRTDESRGEHAGIQFDPLAPATTSLINRYLVAQLRESSHPRPGCARRPGVPS
jgi:PilZ domain